MLPIYSDLLKMWSDLGYDLPIKEGKYWLENNFIQAFTRDGTLRKLWKYKVFDDLHIEITPYNNKIKFCEGDFETWEETADRLAPDLDTKIKESLAVIRDTVEKYKGYEFLVLTSTGKDSMVTLDLVQKVIPNVRVVFNNTSLDSADTYKMVKSHKNWEITNPKEGFYQYCKRINYIPSQISRGCCSIFKEGNSIEYLDSCKKTLQFLGIKKQDSLKRANRPYIDHNPKWGSRDWWACYPILEWSEIDVWLYMIKNKIEINHKYHQGYHRVGCHVACPYQTKYCWVLDKYWYPSMRERWLRIVRDCFVNSVGWTRLNCTIYEYVNYGWNGTLYRPEPTEEVINEFMEYKGITDRNVALQYFNKTCCECGKNVRQNDVLAMNLKMNGRSTNKIYCKKCLMKELEMSKEEWDNNVADFKAQGCVLF